MAAADEAGGDWAGRTNGRPPCRVRVYTWAAPWFMTGTRTRPRNASTWRRNTLRRAAGRRRRGSHKRRSGYTRPPSPKVRRRGEGDFHDYGFLLPKYFPKFSSSGPRVARGWCRVVLSSEEKCAGGPAGINRTRSFWEVNYSFSFLRLRGAGQLMNFITPCCVEDELIGHDYARTICSWVAQK